MLNHVAIRDGIAEAKDLAKFLKGQGVQDVDEYIRSPVHMKARDAAYRAERNKGIGELKAELASLKAQLKS